MQTLSYTISPVLSQTLKTIEASRQSLLLQPLAPKTELRLRWEAHVSRIYHSLHLAHNPVSKKDIIKILAAPGKKRMTSEEQDVLRYKRTLDYIREEWLVNPKPLMPQTVHTVYHMATGEKMNVPEQTVMEVLVFLQTSSENAFIQAFISYIQLMTLLPVNDTTGKVARVFPYLFLYKEGLDFRGLLVLEEYFYQHERLLRDLFDAVQRQESVTVWLEHFLQMIANQLHETQKSLSQQGGGVSVKLWDLTERQKDILSSFDQPGLRITNKKVQELYKVSQITASRDLAKLASLGLLLPYGKGRSVYYVKV